MLTVSALGMAGYGAHEVVTGLMDFFGAGRLELWAQLALILFGLLLVVGAVLVRVPLPGGFELALGAILALQALAVHNAVHLSAASTILPQIARGAFAAVLAGLAWLGGRVAR